MTEYEDTGILRRPTIHAKPRRKVWAGWVAVSTRWKGAVFAAVADRGGKFSFRGADQRVPTPEHLLRMSPGRMKACVNEDDIGPNAD
jgi:hypothetical protein